MQPVLTSQGAGAGAESTSLRRRERRSSLELEVAKVEEAEKQLNNFIERRTNLKEAANAEADRWKASEIRHQEERRREHIELWIHHHYQQAEEHARISADHTRRARALEGKIEGGK
jgi:hypothetical protein